jgi:hypothetical protein
MVRAVARRAVAMPVPGLITWQQAIERSDQIGVGAGPDLDDDEAGRGVRNEDGQQAVDRVDLSQKGLAGTGEIGQPAALAGADRQLAGVYGKTLRSASRSRPSPPRAGADS